MTLIILAYLNIHILNLLFLQKYIIILALLFDVYNYVLGKTPCSWNNFYNNKGIYTWYSGWYYSDKKKLKKIIFFIFISKIIFILQIICALDLLIFRIWKPKIKYKDNPIYITFIVIPWIYINLFLIKIKSLNINKGELKIIINNYIFINLWLTGKQIVANSLILLDAWENWTKHTYYPKLKFLKFLKLSQKYYFNTLNEKYNKYFTT